MNRIETAIQQASCVFVLGDNATSPEVQHELSARNIPYCLLDPSEEAESTESTAAPQALSVDALGPALNSRSSGMIVVVAPSFMETGLDTLAGIVAAAQSRPRLFFVTKAMNKSALPSQLRSWKIQQIKRNALPFARALAGGSSPETGLAGLGALLGNSPAPTAQQDTTATEQPSSRKKKKKDRKRNARAQQGQESLNNLLSMFGAPGHRPQPQPQHQATKSAVTPIAAQLPEPVFVGRENELHALAAQWAVSSPPSVVIGPAGIGKRSVVLETVRRWSKLRGDDQPESVKLVTELELTRSINTEAFLGRIAEICRAEGDDSLYRALVAGRDRPSTVELIGLVKTALKNEALAKYAMLVTGMETLLDRKSGSFYRMEFLECLLTELLNTPIALQLVFTSTLNPQVSESVIGQSETPTTEWIRLTGLSAMDGLQLLEHWKCGIDGSRSMPSKEESAEGENAETEAPLLTEALIERADGHPIAIRNIAAAVLNRTEDASDTQHNSAALEAFLADPAAGQLSSINNTDRLAKIIRRRFDQLREEERSKFLKLALRTRCFETAIISDHGINRKLRFSLVNLGLLEQTLNPENRSYRIHPLVRKALPHRALYDFEVMRAVAETLKDEAKGISSALKAAKEASDEPFTDSQHLQLRELEVVHEINSLLTSARHTKGLWRVSVPFSDPLVSNIRELLFHRTPPRNDIAALILKDGLRNSPNNPDLLLLELALAKRTPAPTTSSTEAINGGAPPEENIKQSRKRRSKGNKKGAPKSGVNISNMEALYQRLRQVAPTPESFMQEANYHLEKKSSYNAISVLMQSQELFPNCDMLTLKLGNLLLRGGELGKARKLLNQVLNQRPEDADTKSRLGEIELRLGTAHWDRAFELLTEARSHYEARGQTIPPAHLIREANALRYRSMISGEQELIIQAEEILRQGQRRDSQNLQIKVALATVLLDLNGNPEEIELLLKAPLKKRDRAEAFIQQARLLIRKNELENVQSNLDRAFRLAKNSPETLSVRGEYFMARNEMVNALSAFQSALDAYPETAPERALNQRMVEQITAIIATQGNEDYSAQRPVVEAIPVSAPATNVLRRKANNANPQPTTVEPEEKQADDASETPSANNSER